MFENVSVCAYGDSGTTLALETCFILQAITECLLCGGPRLGQEVPSADHQVMLG